MYFYFFFLDLGLGLSFVWVKAEAATLLTLAGVLGSLRSLPAIDATFGEVCSFFLGIITHLTINSVKTFIEEYKIQKKNQLLRSYYHYNKNFEYYKENPNILSEISEKKRELNLYKDILKEVNRRIEELQPETNELPVITSD